MMMLIVIYFVNFVLPRVIVIPITYTCSQACTAIMS